MTKQRISNNDEKSPAFFFKPNKLKEIHLDFSSKQSQKSGHPFTLYNGSPTFSPPAEPPAPPITYKDKDKGPKSEVVIVIYEGGEREVYCPAKKIKEERNCVHIEFYNRIFELKKVLRTEVL